MMSAAPAPIGRCGRATASMNADEIEPKVGSPSGHVGDPQPLGVTILYPLRSPAISISSTASGMDV
jgi:hypothetical protein